MSHGDPAIFKLFQAPQNVDVDGTGRERDFAGRLAEIEGLRSRTLKGQIEDWVLKEISSPSVRKNSKGVCWKYVRFPDGVDEREWIDEINSLHPRVSCKIVWDEGSYIEAGTAGRTRRFMLCLAPPPSSPSSG